MLHFTYIERGTTESRMIHKNQIRIWKDENGDFVYDRRYVSKDGKVSDSIEQTFKKNDDAQTMMNLIHWGCCGWIKYFGKDDENVKKIQAYIDSLG